jgi:hypothetical protein
MNTGYTNPLSNFFLKTHTNICVHTNRVFGSFSTYRHVLLFSGFNIHFVVNYGECHKKIRKMFREKEALNRGLQ